MQLWLEWVRCVLELRSACARGRTFLWMSLALLGLSVCAELDSEMARLWIKGMVTHAGHEGRKVFQRRRRTAHHSRHVEPRSARRTGSRMVATDPRGVRLIFVSL